MKDARLLCVCVYILLVTRAWSVPAALPSLSDEEVRDIEKFVGDVMGCANIPGLALTVIRGEATFSTGLGVANMATGHPVDRRTLFGLGSTSKAFLPYVLAEIMNGKENHDGRITWKSALKDIIKPGHDPEFPLTWADVTLKDMLVYKSGSSAADMSIMAGLPEHVSRQEILQRLRFVPKTPEFLNSNHYSNIMYTVAGHLAERISGMPWPALVKARVFDKLSMSTATLTHEGLAIEDTALAYKFQAAKPGEQFLEQNTTLFNLRPSEPAGALMVSAEDMSKWLRHILQNLNAKGNDSGINLLISDAMHLWVTLPAQHRDGPLTHESEQAYGFGMGWYSSVYRGQRRFQYTGHLYGFRSQIWLFPDSFSAIFVSVNGPGMEASQRALQGIMYHISDTVLRKPSWVDNETACCCADTHDSDRFNDHNIKRKLINEKLMTYMAPVEKYTGLFGNGLIGDMNIGLNETGILVAKIGRNLVGELTPSGSESKLNFAASGALANTEEWFDEKTFQFSKSGEQNDKQPFDSVKVFVSEHLFYEFRRGESFDSLLRIAEENERKQNDDDKVLIQNDHISRSTKFGSPSRKTTNTAGGADADKEDNTDRNKNSHRDNTNSGFESPSGAQINSGDHHSHQALSMDGGGPDTGYTNEPESNLDMNNTMNRSQPGGVSSKVIASYPLTVLFIILHILWKV